MPISDQTKEVRPPYVNNQIKFLLEVTATTSGKRGFKDNNPIEIRLNLNPDNSIVTIDQSLSTEKDLIMIFDRIKGLITKLNRRTRSYAAAIKIDKNALGPFSVEVKSGDYDQNFKPTFEKIDRIIYQHKSPGIATVSYASTYNGDIPPSKKRGGDL